MKKRIMIYTLALTVFSAGASTKGNHTNATNKQENRQKPELLPKPVYYGPENRPNPALPTTTKPALPTTTKTALPTTTILDVLKSTPVPRPRPSSGPAARKSSIKKSTEEGPGLRQALEAAREEQTIAREQQTIAREQQTIAREQQTIAREEQATATAQKREPETDKTTAIERKQKFTNNMAAISRNFIPMEKTTTKTAEKIAIEKAKERLKLEKERLKLEKEAKESNGDGDDNPEEDPKTPVTPGIEFIDGTIPKAPPMPGKYEKNPKGEFEFIPYEVKLKQKSVDTSSVDTSSNDSTNSGSITKKLPKPPKGALKINPEEINQNRLKSSGNRQRKPLTKEQIAKMEERIARDKEELAKMEEQEKIIRKNN